MTCGTDMVDAAVTDMGSECTVIVENKDNKCSSGTLVAVVVEHIQVVHCCIQRIKEYRIGKALAIPVFPDI